MKPLRWLVVGVLSVVVGCSKPAAQKTADSKGQEENKKPVASQTMKPDEALRAMTVTLVVENRPELIWQALPPSYQKDVKDIVSQFAGKMDAEVWNKAFAVARKAVDVLKKQKTNIIELIKQNPLVPLDEAQMTNVSEHWDEVVGLLEILVNSEFAKLESLKEADIEKFLSGTIKNFMNKATAIAKKVDDAEASKSIEKLKNAKIEVVKATDTEATVKVDSGEESHEIQMVKVDGKWLPKDMVDAWEGQIRSAKQRLEGIDTETVQKFKPIILSALDAVEKGLDKLATAKTPAELVQRAQELASEIMQAAGQPQQ
ncbi:MAG: hypothetical protein KatS3mg105_0397 [Gemmatales bacterium]|nr:MAG: hypothetical protein KatS3mg105_0397 [Gemmatales bacterium]